jgi:uncharacterized membrane protein YjjB (DUF3815 family)
MTHTNFSLLVRRAFERLVASVAALTLTALLLVSVDARAATHRKLTPSVTVLVPTVTVLVPSVTIEALD